ncbi:hypothetical protein [Kibdelosporangium philippinense]
MAKQPAPPVPCLSPEYRPCRLVRQQHSVILVRGRDHGCGHRVINFEV